MSLDFRRSACPAGLLLLAFALPGCTGPRGLTTASPGDTAYVGVAVGLQNPERYVDVFAGVQMALDELNARRAEGAPVLALRRAPADVSSHVAIAAAFRDDPAVVGVVGHTESEATLSAAPMYDDRANGGKRALVAISPTASGALVTRTSDWVFRVCPVGDEQGQAIARYAADSLGMKRLAVVYRNDAMGKSIQRAFALEFERLGGVVVERDPFVEEFTEFEAYAKRLSRRKVDAVAFPGNAAEALELIRELRAAGSRAEVISTNPPLASMLGDPGAARDFAGMRYTALYVPGRPLTDSGRRFAASFRKRFGRDANHWPALSYDAAMLVGEAVHDVGAHRRRVRDWVAEVGRARPAYSGATGEIRFDSWGDPVNKPILFERVGG